MPTEHTAINTVASGSNKASKRFMRRTPFCSSPADGRGRDDYPVRAMWRALVAGVVFGHESSASLLRELGRNPALLEVCGFDPLGWQRPPVRTLERTRTVGRRWWSFRARGGTGVSQSHFPCVNSEFPSARRDGVPTEAAFSRFLSSVVRLEEETGAVSAMAATLRGRLMEALPGFGRHLGYDGKALPSHSTGRKDAASGKTSAPDADWGKHETVGVDGRTGKGWTKVKSWFGYSFHLIADVEHEVPVWFGVERASASEHRVLASGVEELFAAEPELAARCGDFCADRGLDSAALKKTLWEAHGVRPVVDTREMWRDEKAEPGRDPSERILRLARDDRPDNVPHSEKGRVFCRCPASGTVPLMAFQGFEKDRGTLKYRCPAAACDLDCAGRERCERESGSRCGAYGRVFRIALKDADRRVFTPTPHGAPSWNRAYARRSALERINSRLDGAYRFERHFVRGKAKMRTRVGLAVCVMMALALAAAEAGRLDRMRSLVKPAFADTG